MPASFGAGNIGLEMTPNEILLIALIVIFALPWAVWRLLGRKSWAPLVVVQIVGGILLGPGVFGRLAPDLHAAVFGQGTITSLSSLALWAVMIFVWLAGVELDLDGVRKQWRQTGIVAGLALAVPMVAGVGVGIVLLQSPGWAGDKAENWQVATGLGMACAVTALPILVLFMEQLGILRAKLGQRILSYASLDDVAIWAVLAVILMDGEKLMKQLGFVLVFLTLSVPVRRLILRCAMDDRWAVALVWMLLMALGADWSGLHFMVGAFLAGAVIDRHWLGEDRVETFRKHILLILMPIFFLSSGLRTSWGTGGVEVILAALALLAAAVVGKLVGVGIAGRILGWEKGEAWTIGWLLQTKALIMIIFANVLLDKGVISASAFTALLLMAVASTVLTMPVVGRLIRRYPGLVEKAG